MNEPTIVTVLRSGGDFAPEHVRWLKRQFDTHHPSVPFKCLTNTVMDDIDTIPLLYNWEGWWSKLELFTHFQNAFYVDLDTVIHQPIHNLLNHVPKGIMALRKLSGLLDGDPDSIGSGVMRWKGDYSHITRAFKTNPAKHMDEYSHKFKWADQGFILAHIDEFEYLQDRFPGAVVSYKRIEGLDYGRNPLPPQTQIIAFHGQPRPWNVNERYVPQL